MRNIDFNRDTSDHSMAIRRVVIALAALLVLGVLVFIVILAKNDFNIRRFIGTEDVTAAEEDASSETGADEFAAPFSDADAVNVLFLCGQDGAVSFCDILSFSAAENSIRVKPVSPDLRLEFRGQTTQVADVFYNFGGAEIARAMSDHNVPVSRWITISDDGFRQLIIALGEVDVEIPNNVSFAVDAVRYDLKKGVQTLNGDTLLNTMKHAFSEEVALRFQAEAVGAVLRQYLTAETLERGEDFFSDFINLTDSNITAFDFAEYGPAIIEFLSRSPEITVIS